MSQPVYIIGAHDGTLLLADEQFSRFWRTADSLRPPERSAADEIGLALRAATPFFHYAGRSELSGQDVVLVSIPTAHGSLRPDSAVRDFPDHLRAASQRYPAYPLLDEAGSSGLYDLEEQRGLFRGLVWRDLGELSAEAIADPETLAQVSTRFIEWAVRNDVRTIAIGGDHAMTYPLVRALAHHAGAPVILVDFDAHNDCGVNVHPEDRIHHANFVRHLLALERVAGVVQIGVRGIRSPGQLFSHAKLIQVPPSAHSQQDLLAAVAHFRALAPDAVGYLSIDLDVLDPRDFPWVDFPTSGGLSIRHLITLLQTVFRSPLPVIGADIVEGCGGGSVEQNDYDVPLCVLAHVMDGLHGQRRRSPDDDHERRSTP
jgi:arginase family enzyme